VSAIRMHRPNEVDEIGSNVVEVKEEPDLQHEGMPLWKLQGVEGSYTQKDNYSCGPLAINCFAKIMKELSNDKVLGDGIDEYVRFMDTANENIANARSLLESLLKKGPTFSRARCKRRGKKGGQRMRMTPRILCLSSMRR